MNIHKISANQTNFTGGVSRLKRPFRRVDFINRCSTNVVKDVSVKNPLFASLLAQSSLYLSLNFDKGLPEISITNSLDERLQGLMIRKKPLSLSDDGEKKEGKWVEILSYKNDKENFIQNVEMLKAISHGNWKTKTYNADVNLRRGDFHVYMVDGEPQVGIRFLDDSIYEIVGVNGAIPARYYEEIVKHVETFPLTGSVVNELKNCKEQKHKAQKIRNEISEWLRIGDLPSILKHLNVPHESLLNDNVIILSDLGAPNRYFDWCDIGVDINKVLERVVKVCGDVKFSDSQLKSLGNISKIEGDLNLVGTSIKSLGDNLKEVGGSLHLQNSRLEDLGALESVGKIARFSGSEVKSLGNLKYVGKDLMLMDSKVKDLGKLVRVEGCVYCSGLDYDEEKLLEGGIYVKGGIVDSTVNFFGFY